MSTSEQRNSNPITPHVLEGIRSRHAAVEADSSPCEAAERMAYLSHVDRGDLLLELERLRLNVKMRPAPTADCECGTCFAIRQLNKGLAVETTAPQSSVGVDPECTCGLSSADPNDHAMLCPVVLGDRAAPKTAADPDPARSRLHVSRICTAYESGIGRGLSGRDLSQPYAAECDESTAYYEGWTVGRTRIAATTPDCRHVENNPIADTHASWCTECGAFYDGSDWIYARNAVQETKGEPAAWMTDDGRICTAERKSRGMARDFTIPLYRHPRPWHQVEKAALGADGVATSEYVTALHKRCNDQQRELARLNRRLTNMATGLRADGDRDKAQPGKTPGDTTDAPPVLSETKAGPPFTCSVAGCPGEHPKDWNVCALEASPPGAEGK